MDIKRHMITDIFGLLHTITVAAVNITDRNGAIEAITLLSIVKSIIVDSRYTRKPFIDTINELSDATVEVAKRSELHTFKVIPKR